MSREEWLKERRNSIGGSEMGAILGLNKYASAYTVWAVKTGLMDEPEDNEDRRGGEKRMILAILDIVITVAWCITTVGFSVLTLSVLWSYIKPAIRKGGRKNENKR